MKRRTRRGFGENGFESRGGYMEAKKAKLKEQFVELASKECIDTGRGIFHGIAIFINGYTVPTADELKRIMMTHGGMFHQYMSERTTHIIATNLPNVKIKRLRVMRVVKPDWIVDSVKAGKLLDYRSYLLYSHQSVTQPRLAFGVSDSSHTLNGTSSSFSVQENCQSSTPKSSFNSCDTLKQNNNNTQTTISQDAIVLPSRSNSEETSSNNKLSTVTSQDDNVTVNCFLTEEKHLQDKLPMSRTCPTSPNDKNDLNNTTENANLTSGSDSGSIGSDKHLTTEELENVNVLEMYSTNKKSVLESKLASHEMGSSKSSSWNVRSAGEAGFLTEFYNNSRLHHISTMGAMFKQYVNVLREKSNQVFIGQNRLGEWMKTRRNELVVDDVNDIDDIRDVVSNRLEKNNKVIMHIDMDCFFVSVGLRNRPDLRGQPVAVTHAKGNPSAAAARPGVDRKREFQFYKQKLQDKHAKSHGEDKVSEKDRPSRVDDMDETSSMSEIASCSYEARQAGLKNGMFLGQALKLCPNLKTIPYDFEGYKEVSYILYNTVASYTLDIEAVSCDELFVDCTSLLKKTGAGPLDFATIIRQEIKSQTGCPASTGFGSNMLQARLATKQAKPDGQFHLKPADAAVFMRDIQVKDLPGVGRSMSYKLDGMSVTTCGDLQQVSLGKLQQEFGSKTGGNLYHHCRGEDDRKLTFDHVRKSVSAEVNYGIRFTSQDEADKFYQQLAEEVATRLKEINVKGRCITLKLMVRAKDAPTETAKFMGHGICDYITKSTSLTRAVDDSNTIAREVLSIAQQFRLPPTDLRGIGIQVTRLENQSRKTSGGLDNFLVKKKTTETKHASETPQSKLKGVNSTKPQTEEVSELAMTPADSQSGDSWPAAEEMAATDDDAMRLDPEVLAALPGRIREEVVQEYRRKHESVAVAGPSRETNQRERTCQQKYKGVKFKEQSLNFSQIEPSFLAALPVDLQNELRVELCRTSSPSPQITEAEPDTENDWKTMHNHPCIQRTSGKKRNESIETTRILPQDSKTIPVGAPDEPGLSCELTLPEMRALIKEWVGTESVPQPCDVDMLARHFQQLAATRQIEILDLLVKCLHRSISKKHCITWVEAYHSIIRKAQDTMEIVYGSRLKVPNCKSDQ